MKTFFIFCFLSLITCKEVHAQQVTELTVSPPVAYVQVQPGSVSRHTITLQNTGTQTITVTTSLVDFKPAPETGIPVLSQTNSFPYLDEESKNLPQLTLEPQAKAQLTLQFTVPQFAPEKEYPLTVLFSTKVADPAALVSAASVQNTIGSNLIILVSNKTELEQQLTVSDFNIPKIIDSFSSLSMQPIAKNGRFSSSIASGSATLKNGFGQTVAEYTIYPDVVLGLNERPLRFIQVGTLQNADLEPTSFIYNPALFLGIYTLTIQFTPTTAIPSAASFSYTFFALPLVVLLALAVLILVYAYIWYRRQASLTM